MATPQCSICWYGQTTQTITGVAVRVCRRDAPALINPGPLSSDTYIWPRVKDTDWCGEGIDVTTGKPYAFAAAGTAPGWNGS